MCKNDCIHMKKNSQSSSVTAAGSTSLIIFI